MGRGDPERLARVEHRAAAEPDDAVAAAFAIDRQRALDAGHRRIGRNAVINGNVRIAGQRGAQLVDDAVLHQPGIGDHQRPANGARSELAGELADGAMVEMHGGKARQDRHVVISRAPF